MKNYQKYLFPEFEEVNIKKEDGIDVTSIDMHFSGKGQIHHSANRLINKLRSLKKDTYYLFKENEEGFPYVINIKKNHTLSINTSRNQYPCVSIASVAIACHRLFAFAFIENIDTELYTVVDHINEDKTDYRIKNLQWVSSSENSKRRYRKRNY